MLNLYLYLLLLINYLCICNATTSCFLKKTECISAHELSKTTTTATEDAIDERTSDKNSFCSIDHEERIGSQFTISTAPSASIASFPKDRSSAQTQRLLLCDIIIISHQRLLDEIVVEYAASYSYRSSTTQNRSTFRKRPPKLSVFLEPMICSDGKTRSSSAGGKELFYISKNRCNVIMNKVAVVIRQGKYSYKVTTVDGEDTEMITHRNYLTHDKYRQYQLMTNLAAHGRNCEYWNRTAEHTREEYSRDFSLRCDCEGDQGEEEGDLGNLMV